MFEIYVRSYLGDVIKRQVSNGGGRSPRWSRDGTGLFYRNGLESMAVDVDTRDGLALGRPRTLFEKEGGFDVAPDGQHFVMNERVESEPPPSELILVKHWVEELERLVPTEN